MSRRLNGITDENYSSHLSNSDINHVSGAEMQLPGVEATTSKVYSLAIVLLLAIMINFAVHSFVLLFPLRCPSRVLKKTYLNYGRVILFKDISHYAWSLLFCFALARN